MSSFSRLHLIRQVDLFTLRLFLTVAEERQIGRAALRENIAPSTATKRVQDLEEIVGLKLFERNPSGVAPTPAGEVVLRYIRMIFGNLDDMTSEIAAFNDGVRGVMTIASARSIIVPFLARELGNYVRDFPLVEVAVREMENAEIVQAVAQGDADIGVFAAARGLDLSGVDVAPYRKDRMVVVVPRGHPLSARLSVSFEDLLPENLIVVAAMKNAFQAAAKRLGRECKPKYSVKSAGVAISLVQAGLGITVQPECLLGLEFVDHVSAVNFAEPWAVRAIHIATARGRVLGPAAQTMLKQLMDRPRSPAPE